MDRSVHRSLIEEQDFIHSAIRGMASKNCERLICALRPLYGKKFRSKVVKTLRMRLESVFEVAIRIRSLSLVSTEEYECIWPLAGSEFDSMEMESQGAKVIERSIKIKATTTPGLRAYTRKLGMVSYSGFETGGGRDSKSESVVRATVLV
jgi:hypothetical protein